MAIKYKLKIVIKNLQENKNQNLNYYNFNSKPPTRLINFNPLAMPYHSLITFFLNPIMLTVINI